MVEHHSPICLPSFFAVISCMFYLGRWARSFLRKRMPTFFLLPMALEKKKKTAQTRPSQPLLWQSLWLGSLHVHLQPSSPLLFSTTKAGSQVPSLPVSLTARGSHGHSCGCLQQRSLRKLCFPLYFFRDYKAYCVV